MKILINKNLGASPLSTVTIDRKHNQEYQIPLSNPHEAIVPVVTHWMQDIRELRRPEIEQQLALYSPEVLSKTTVVVMKLFTKTTAEWIRDDIFLPMDRELFLMAMLQVLC